MNITTRFSPGDIVFAVGLLRTEERKRCSTCEGGTQVIYDERDRNVTLSAVEIKGRLFACPACEGEGAKRVTHQAYGLQSGRVTQVTFSQEEGRTPVITYRLGHGADGRSVFREDQCYDNQADAQARADASNSYRNPPAGEA